MYTSTLELEINGPFQYDIFPFFVLIFVDPDLTLDYSHLANLLVPQKRRLCQKYFIYNPVRGKCTPTVMVSFNNNHPFLCTYVLWPTTYMKTSFIFELDSYLVRTRPDKNLFKKKTFFMSVVGHGTYDITDSCEF